MKEQVPDKNSRTIVNLHKSQVQCDIAHTHAYIHADHTQKQTHSWRLDPAERPPKELHHTELESWQHFFFFFQEGPPADSKKPTLLLLCMKYGTTMNYTQHLLIWHAKYTCLMRQYRSFCGGTPVPPNVTWRWRLIYVPPLHHSAWMYYWYIQSFMSLSVWPLTAVLGRRGVS